MDFTTFENLTNAIAAIPEIDMSRITEIDLETQGIDTDIIKILFNGPYGELLYILPNGKVSKIAVHISAIKEQYKDSYKYHIFNCEVLHKMKYNAREEKYKSNSRIDGTFFMIMSDRYNQVSFRDYYPLNICNYCLTLYNKKYNKTSQAETFNLQEYHDKAIADNNLDIWADLPNDMEMAPQVYIKEWEEISRNLKIQHHYICERCNENFINHKKYLHAHHIDMNVRNNHSKNIKILCVVCHGREPNHTHVNSSPEWRELMELRKQGVMVP